MFKKTFRQFKNKYGSDWRCNANYRELVLFNNDLSQIKIPEYQHFFRITNSGSFVGCTFPAIDFTGYDLVNVTFTDCFFPKNTVLTPAFLGALKGVNRLDIHDFSNVDFTGVNLNKFYFGKNDILPTNEDFFQVLASTNLENAMLPENIDIFKYDVAGIKFPNSFNDAILEYIFENLETFISNKLVNLPVVTRDIRDLDGYLNFNTEMFQNRLSGEKLNILKIRYPNEITEKKIIFPRKLLSITDSKFKDVII